MTFDEMIEKVLNNENYNTDGLSVDDAITLIEDLRLEYAPTIELTQEQYDVLGELDIDIIKQVLLHPETVKVVGEVND